ncbi:MAG: hypothetical protein GX907_03785 [Clostridiaceae bacterium]|nr:hypothetical protein [Clostridiaceae bacterium]
MKHIPLLKSKLMIPEVPRQALLCDRILNLSLSERRLTVLIAPAGFGKTTAVLLALNPYRERIKWYRLEKEDNFLTVFYAHLIETLFAGEDKKLLGSVDMLKSIQNLDEEYVLLNAQITQDMYTIHGRREEKVFLVLDDFHHVHDNEIIIDTMRYFTVNWPDSVSIVITSRTPLPLVSGKLAIREDIKQIGSEALIFSREETEQLITEKYNLQLSKAQLDFIFKSTEGWIAGIYMICHSREFLSAKHPRSERREKFTDLLTTFMGTFLNDIAPQRKLLLQQLSLLDDFSLEEVEGFFRLPAAEEFFLWLEESNLYIQKTSTHPARYRFHSLFKEELNRSYLAETDSRSRRELSTALGEYYRDKDPRLAIRFYLQAELKEKALEVVRSLSRQLFNEGSPEKMFFIVNEFPEEIIAKDPYLMLFQGMTRMNIDRAASMQIFLAAMDGFRKCRDYTFLMNTFGMMLVTAYQDNNFVLLEQASKKLPVALLFAGKEVVAKVLISLFTAATGRDQLRRAGLIRKILRLFPVKDEMWQYSYLMISGIYHYRSGDLEAAADILTEILNHPVALKNDQWRIIGLVSCCNVPFLKADKTLLKNFADEFYLLGERYASDFSTGYGHFVAAHSKYMDQDLAGALKLIDDSIDSYTAYGSNLLIHESKLIHFLWEEGIPDAEELRKAKEVGAAVKSEDPGHGMIEFADVVLGVLYKRAGLMNEAETCLLRALKGVAKKGVKQSVCGISLQLAGLYLDMEEPVRARYYALQWRDKSVAENFLFWRELDRQTLRRVYQALLEQGASDAWLEKIADLYLRARPAAEVREAQVVRRVNLLGEFEFKVGEHSITEQNFKTKKAAGILKYMLLQDVSKHISRPKLAAIFWPESNTKAAQTSLRVALCELRKLLPEFGLDFADADGLLVEDKEGFALRDGVSLERDIDILESKYNLFTQSLRADEPDYNLLRDVCMIYRGPLLNGESYDEGVSVRQEHYQSIFFASLYALCEEEIRRGVYSEAEKLLIKGLIFDSLNERCYSLLLSIYRQTGQLSRAKYLRKLFSERFRGEIGAEPDLA